MSISNFTDKTSTNSLGTAYQNTTGRAVFVVVSINGSDQAKGYSNSNSTPSSGTPVAWAGFNAANAIYAYIAFWVKPGDYYQVSNVGGSLQQWVEWTF